MKITVRTAGGSCCEIARGDRWTFRDLSREVEEKLDVPLMQQQLLHGHRHLKGFMRTAAIETMGELLRMEGGPGMALELSLYIWFPEYAQALREVEDAGMALQYVPEELKGDREVVMEAVRQDGRALRFASEELKGDREVVMAAVRKSGSALRFASEELKGDREVVIEAVRKNGTALRFASEELKVDREFVMAAVIQDWRAHRFASEELKGNREFVMAAFDLDWRRLGSLLRS